MPPLCSLLENGIFQLLGDSCLVRITLTFTAIAKYKPQDATTNPSLILAASKKPEYQKLINAAVEYGKKQGGSIDSQVDHALDRLLVEFGKEILNIVPGKVSTEVDAQFSYDTKASVDKALHIIDVCCPKSYSREINSILKPHSSTRSRASPRIAS